MSDYINYMKCGEILKSPTINEKDHEYVLKCVQCEEDHHFLLDSFVFPCAGQSEAITNEENSSIHGSLTESKSVDNQIQEHADGHDLIKFEDMVYDEGDPLNIIKDNNDSIYEDVKEEYLLQEPEEFIDTLNEIVEESFEADYSEEVNSEYIESDDVSVESDGCKTDVFVHSFMKSRQSVKALIEAYKSQSNLWNRKHPQFRLKEQHTKYLENMREELKEKKNLQITCNQVAAVVQNVCRKYKEDLKSKGGNENDHKSQLWFSKHLEFLKPFLENTSTENCRSLQTELVPEQIIQVLAIYKRFPHLWNTNLVENCCRNKRHEALSQMMQVIESEMGLSITENSLKKYLHFIHTRFTKEKRRNIRNNDTNAKCSYEYYRHMKFLNDHVGPFKCSECDIELRNPLYFKVHKSQHDGSIPLKCSLCSKEFKILRTYTLHARRHMDDLEEECKECGKKFINTCELNIHMRFHTGAKPYCCEICGVSFRHIQTFTSHKRRHEKQYLHKCPICTKGFYTKAKMDDHIRSHKQIREFSCGTCGKAFITKKTLQQHQVTHEDIRRHACTLCGKSFKLKVGVTQHMKTHGSQIYERPDDSKKN